MKSDTNTALYHKYFNPSSRDGGYGFHYVSADVLHNMYGFRIVRRLALSGFTKKLYSDYSAILNDSDIPYRYMPEGECLSLE